jgi:hypothetical protein
MQMAVGSILFVCILLFNLPLLRVLMLRWEVEGIN